MILGLIDEAVASGARQARVCAEIGLDPTTVQRWRRDGIGSDGRAGPQTAPKNKLTDAEREQIRSVACSAEFRDMSPNQIVPRLADRGVYIASESTFYRVLTEQDLAHHRGRAKSPTRRSRPQPKVATGPRQVWSWDITYLPGPARGTFFYLYTVLDVWSRKIVASEVHPRESADLAAAMIERTCEAESIEPGVLTLHSDNGGPMKGATMLATLQALGVVASFSRPRVSDDNPYSESLFRTLKYRPEYPSNPFESIDTARAWVDGFVHWYNREHLHSAVGFVTPQDRHDGGHHETLSRRRRVFQSARDRSPERWTGRVIRKLDTVDEVTMHDAVQEESTAA